MYLFLLFFSYLMIILFSLRYFCVKTTEIILSNAVLILNLRFIQYIQCNQLLFRRHTARVKSIISGSLLALEQNNL